MLRHIGFFIFFAIAFSACNEDFFDQVVDIDPPPHTPQITAFLTVSNRDTGLAFKVGRSYGLLEQTPDSAYYLRGATVAIYENGALWEEFAGHNSFPEVYEYISKIENTPQSGRTYELRISHPDFGQVSAVQTMPVPISVIKTEGQLNGGITGFGDRLSAVYATVNDPPGEKNYYALGISEMSFFLQPIFDDQFNIIGFDTIGVDEYRSYLDDSLDPAGIPGMNGEILFSDEAFDGQNYRLSARFYNYNQQQGRTVQLHLRHVTPEYYRFSITERRRYDAEDFPLAEPVTVFYNLQGGIGIFRMAHEQTFSVELK